MFVAILYRTCNRETEILQKAVQHGSQWNWIFNRLKLLKHNISGLIKQEFYIFYFSNRLQRSVRKSIELSYLERPTLEK